MRRDDVIAALADFAGPLGPLRSPAELESARRRWVETTDLAAFESLLGLLLRPTPDLARLNPDDVEFELSELLIGLGRRDVDAALHQLAPLAGVLAARPVVIDVLGGLGPAALALLEPLVRDSSLSADNTVRLACALGEIGGAPARRLLLVLRERAKDPTSAVAQEIATALAAVDRSC
ncbi:MAG: hypothetical protein ABW215_17055 [Kibdelosporangium sp.]